MYVWARVSRHHGLAEQQKLAAEHGAIQVWIEGQDGITIEHFANARVAGDVVGVSTFGRLGRTRDQWSAAVSEILIKRRCTIVELSTGRALKAPRDAEIATISMEVADELSGDAKALSKRQQRINANLMNATLQAQREANRMPSAKAVKYWKNLKLKEVEALELMDGWTGKSARNAFGKRGFNTGRPPKSAKR